jgi:hypothetical protein
VRGFSSAIRLLKEAIMVHRTHGKLKDLADAVRRLALRPAPGTRYRCEVCGARVGQQCADPFCYGSLGDLPSPASHRR